MNIIVLVKLVSVSDTAQDDIRDNDRLKNGSLTINPVDSHALELAVSLKKKIGASVTVLSMGPLEAEAMLKDCFTRGADRCVLIYDPSLAGSDTLVTATVLAAAIGKEKDTGLVLCGRSAVDSETGHIGPEVAVFARMPCLTGILSAEIYCMEVEAAVLTDHSIQTIRAPLPAVLSVCPGINRPALPTIFDMHKAKGKHIETISCRELGVDPALAGTKGSPTMVKSVNRSPYLQRTSKKAEQEQGVRLLNDLLYGCQWKHV